MTRQTGPMIRMLSARKTGTRARPPGAGEPPDRERDGGDDGEGRADQERRLRPVDLPPDAEEDRGRQRREPDARMEGAERPSPRARADQIGDERALRSFRQ